MRIVFIGTVTFSLKALHRLFERGADVVGLITHREALFNDDWADLAAPCRDHGVPVHFAKPKDAEGIAAWTRERRPDVIFCFGWSQLLAPSVIAAAPMGAVGFHPAELPYHRGRHPLIWALALGLERTATTFFFITEGADSGDILDQEPLPIFYEDDAGSLYRRMTVNALAQLDRLLPALATGTHRRRPQAAAAATCWRKRSKRDGAIDFRMGSRAIYNLVRALARPYAGAHVEVAGREIKVWRVVEQEAPRMPAAEPGKVLRAGNDGILVKCYDQAVLLVDHEFTALPTVGDYIG